MPKTIYGEIDTQEVITQHLSVEKFCPRVGGDFESMKTGQKFMQSGTFLVSGDETRVPEITPEGETSPKDLLGHSQGYKLHVSAHPCQTFAVAKAVLPIFRQNENGDNPLCGVFHKVAVVKDYTMDKDVDKRGKFITVYAKDEKELKQIAAQIEKALLENGISGQSHGGGLSKGEEQLGTSDMVSMRWGQFSGPKQEKVYLNGKFEYDDRSVPCPPSKKEEFYRVVEETNEQMQQARLNVKQPQQSHSNTTVRIENNNIAPPLKLVRENLEPNTNAPKKEEKKEKEVRFEGNLEEKPKVSDVWKDKSRNERGKGMKFDPNSVNAYIQEYRRHDQGGSGGGGSSLKTHK
jgi:hypothetical protein